MTRDQHTAMNRRRRVTRWLVTAALLLIGGAIINVAVAWACAAMSSFETETRGSLGSSDEALIEEAGEVFNPSIQFIQWNGLGIRQRSVPLEDPLDEQIVIEEMNAHYARGGGPEQPRVSLAFLHRLEAGWPVYAMETRLWEHSKTWMDARGIPLTQSPFWIERGFLVSPPPLLPPRWKLRLDSHRLLPYKPLWPGFAINTLFYAPILWMLFAAPFTLRRWRRKRRGLCVRCAYPIGTNSVCTECGRAVTPRSSEAAT